MTNLPVRSSHTHTLAWGAPGLQTTASRWPIPPAPDTNGAPRPSSASTRANCGPDEHVGAARPVDGADKDSEIRSPPPPVHQRNAAPTHAHSATDLADDSCLHNGAESARSLHALSRRAPGGPSTAPGPRCPAGPRPTAASQSLGRRRSPEADHPVHHSNKALVRRASEPATSYVGIAAAGVRADGRTRAIAPRSSSSSSASRKSRHLRERRGTPRFGYRPQRPARRVVDRCSRQVDP